MTYEYDTRVFYDAIAEDYADRFRAEPSSPVDRSVLATFAELVGAGGRVADLGCGPGRVTAHLASLGLDTHGLDLSESMLAVARRDHPELRFEQGSMFDLGLPDGSLAGAVSWYSTIHTPDERLPALFAELARVLAPGGYLLVGFQVGDVPRTHDRPFGHDVTLAFLRRRPEQVSRLLAEAGLAPYSRTVREPYEEKGEVTRQAMLLVRKPPVRDGAPGLTPGGGSGR